MSNLQYLYNNSGQQGPWNYARSLPCGYFACGMQLRVDLGTDDNTGVNGLKIFGCHRDSL
jgi:hypothetical protein